ncbi:MAG: ribbon-helix-helix protein, CopG family [Actinomycetota bacterium]|nr:ribbon-helix-helix protein, CopG family [Actinomycetota bacterium]
MSKYHFGPDINLDEEIVLDGDGTRITEARAQEIAEETLAKVRRGRPSLSEPGETSPRLSLRIPEQLQTRIEQRAEQEGRPVSEIAREALERYLDA